MNYVKPYNIASSDLSTPLAPCKPLSKYVFGLLSAQCIICIFRSGLRVQRASSSLLDCEASHWTYPNAIPTSNISIRNGQHGMMIIPFYLDETKPNKMKIGQ